jgi:hypothetical protein
MTYYEQHFFANAASRLLEAVIYYRLSKVLMYPRPVKEGKQLIEGRSLGAERLLHDSHTTKMNCAWEHRHRHDLGTSLYSIDSLALSRGQRTVCMHGDISRKAMHQGFKERKHGSAFDGRLPPLYYKL